MPGVREKAEKLIAEKEVAGVLAYRRVAGHLLPVLFQEAGQCRDLVAAGEDRYPLIKILLRIARKYPQEIFGVVVRGCDERALVELCKSHQLHRERVKMIGVACSSETARGCRCHRPYPSDTEESERAKPAEDFSDLEEVEKLPEEERFRFWMAQFGKCIKCYGCRDICPACFCSSCTLEEPSLIPRGETPPEIPIFHLHKAYHMADRCIDCGLCEQVCPMGIPVRRLYQKVRRSVKELFGYLPGEKEEEKGPLEFLGDGSYQLPEAEKRK